LTPARPPEADPSPEINPYAAPEAALGGPDVGALSTADLAEAEAVRRKHIAHETSIKAIGSLHMLGAFGLLIALGFLAFASLSRSGAGVAVLVYVLVMTALNFALGFGLRALRSWARWVDVALLGLSFLINVASYLYGVAQANGGPPAGRVVGMLIGSSIIPGYILYLLTSRKASVVFSPEYQDIIARTPHVKMQTSWLVKGCAVVLVVGLLFLVVAAIFSSGR
jgi:hypothetical protein